MDPTAPDPFIDSHFHLWPATARVGALAKAGGGEGGVGWPAYQAAVGAAPLAAAVAIEVDTAGAIAEADFFEAVAAENPRLQAMVAHAPLEQDNIDSLLNHYRERGFVRGVRRVSQHEPDPGFCARPAFKANAAKLASHGLTCDICVKADQLPAVIDLARSCPETTLVLDHFGKPDMVGDALPAWRDDLARLADLANVVCKLSVVVHGRGSDRWPRGMVSDMIDHAIACFGYDRVMFASNWPVSQAVVTFGDWLETVTAATAKARKAERARLFRGTAAAVYRLAV